MRLHRATAGITTRASRCHRVATGAVLLMSLLLVGCVPTEFIESTDLELATAEEDRQAKLFQVPEGKASIYLYRDQYLARYLPLIVTLDGWVAGQTGEDSYFLWHVDPGPHVITTISGPTQAELVSLPLSTETGRAYYVRQEIPVFSRFQKKSTDLYPVDEQTGVRGVLHADRLRLLSSGNVSDPTGAQAHDPAE